MTYADCNRRTYKDRRIIPEYEVKKTVSDVLNNRDAVMDYTLNLIKRNSQKASPAKTKMPPGFNTTQL